MTQDTAAPSTLYEAAVSFLVAEKSNTNAWEQVATFVSEYVQKVGGWNETTAKYLKREFAIVERQVKKDFEVNKLPVAWRSAKSTAIGALKAGIPLINGDGTAQPKTDVGKLIKATKAGTLTVTDFEKFKHHFNSLMVVYMKLTGRELDDATYMLIGATGGTAVRTLTSAAHATP